MSRRDQRNREKNRKRQTQIDRPDLLKQLIEQVPPKTPMERFLTGVSHEMGLGGVVNEQVRTEVARRLEVLKQPIKQQKWNWEEAHLPEGQKSMLPPDEVPDKVMVCDLYEVWMRKINPEGWPPAWWLSVKRRFTKESVHDWRHLQKIKNDLVGKENEGVELYPAESRLVDTSNQYHLFVLQDPEMKFPIGFQERMVATQSMLGTEQRGFDE